MTAGRRALKIAVIGRGGTATIGGMTQPGGVRIGWSDLPGDPDVVTGVPAGATALFQHRCRQPPPPGLPTVRAFQRFQADALLSSLRDALSRG